MSRETFRDVVPRRKKKNDTCRIVNNVLLKNGFSPLPLSGDESLDTILNLAISTRTNDSGGRFTHSTARGKYRYNDLVNLINIDKDTSILDFGCGDCSLAHYMETIGYTQIFAADLWGEREEERMPIAHFSYIVKRRGRPTIPFGKKKFRYILCMMVLHHINISDIPSTLRSIYRRIPHGGFFVVREHDCKNRRTRTNIDAEHFAYSSIIQSIAAGKLVELTSSDQCHTYLKMDEWIKLIEDIGFRLLYCSEPKTETRKFYMLFHRL